MRAVGIALGALGFLIFAYLSYRNLSTWTVIFTRSKPPEVLSVIGRYWEGWLPIFAGIGLTRGSLKATIGTSVAVWFLAGISEFALAIVFSPSPSYPPLALVEISLLLVLASPAAAIYSAFVSNSYLLVIAVVASYSMVALAASAVGKRFQPSSRALLTPYSTGKGPMVLQSETPEIPPLSFPTRGGVDEQMCGVGWRDDSPHTCERPKGHSWGPHMCKDGALSYDGATTSGYAKSQDDVNALLEKGSPRRDGRGLPYA